MASAPLPNFYEVLGVERDATTADIKSAYRKISRVAHPDVGGNAGLFQLLGEANRVLTDASARKDYDRELAAGTAHTSQRPPPHEPTATRPPPAATPRARQPVPGPMADVSPEMVGDYFDALMEQRAAAAAEKEAADARHQAEREIASKRWLSRSRLYTGASIAAVFLSWWALRATGLIAAVLPGPSANGAVDAVARLVDTVPAVFAAAVAAGLAVAAGYQFAVLYALASPVLELPNRIARRAVTAVAVAACLLGEYLATTAGQVTGALLLALIGAISFAISRGVHRNALTKTRARTKK